MRGLLTILMLALIACSSPSKNNSSNQKEMTPVPPAKNQSKDKTPKTDGATPDDAKEKDDACEEGGCCAANFDKLGFVVDIKGFDRTFVSNALDEAKLTWNENALDAIEGLELLVFATMQKHDHGRIIFGTSYLDEQTVLIQDISFMMPGKWNVFVAFYDGDQLIDQALVPVKVVEQHE